MTRYDARARTYRSASSRDIGLAMSCYEDRSIRRNKRLARDATQKRDLLAISIRQAIPHVAMSNSDSQYLALRYLCRFSPSAPCRATRAIVSMNLTIFNYIYIFLICHHQMLHCNIALLQQYVKQEISNVIMRKQKYHYQCSHQSFVLNIYKVLVPLVVIDFHDLAV